MMLDSDPKKRLIEVIGESDSRDFVISMFCHEAAASRWLDGPAPGETSAVFKDNTTRQCVLLREQALKDAQLLMAKHGGDEPQNVELRYREAVAKGRKVFAMALRAYAEAKWPDRFVSDLFASNGTASGVGERIDDVSAVTEARPETGSEPLDGVA